MNWKFWKKTATEHAGGSSPIKLSGPKDIPESVGMYMVTTLQKDPDWVWTLKAVMREHVDEKHIKDIRVYDPSQTAVQRVSVKNYSTFDARPELILYEGWFNKKNRKFEIKEKTPSAKVKAA
jgi:hypothetical protein